MSSARSSQRGPSLLLAVAIAGACTAPQPKDSTAVSAIHYCDPALAVPWDTLTAAETCDGTTPGVDRRALPRPAWIFTAPIARVTGGIAGNRWAKLSWRDHSGAEGLCLYQETGYELRLSFCSSVAAYVSHACDANPHRCKKDPEVLSSTAIPRGGLIEAAVEIAFSVEDRGVCAPATAEVSLARPPDGDGDGIPECVANPPDLLAPTWPAGSTLATVQSGIDGAILSWSEATDNVAVAGYRIDQDGVQVAEVGALHLTATISGLAAEGAYAFQVQAFDLAGNVSTDGPTASVRIDATAPSWAAGSTLAATATSASTAMLVWTAATDTIGVAGYRLFRDGALVADVGSATLSASVDGLVPETEYLFQVQAYDAAGNVSTSGPSASLRIDGTPPAWPPGSTLAATATGATTATLSWSAATDAVGVTGYRVFQDGIVVAEMDGSTLTADIAGLAPEVTYSFQVQAFDAAGNVSTEGPVATLRIDGTPPGWPEGAALVATATSHSSAALVCTAATDAVGVTGYRVFQDGLVIAEVDAAATSVGATDLVPEVTYLFEVRAFDAAGNVSTARLVTSLRIDGVPPAWPAGSLLATTGTDASSTTLVWTPAIDNVAVAGYRVHQDGSLLVEVDAGTLTARVTGLVPEVTYAFQVQAFDAMGNVSTEGPAVSVRIDGLAPTWPAGSSLVATVTGPGAATLAWTAAQDNDEIAGYLLYRNGVIAHEVGATTLLASFSGLAANVAHTFQVQAFDRAGNVSADGPTAVLRFDGTPPS